MNFERKDETVNSLLIKIVNSLLIKIVEQNEILDCMLD